MLFKDLGLTAELLRAVEKQGYTEATPIQEQAIPIVLAGKDLLAGAQTGTGKTAGFTLPVLQRLQQTHNEGQKRHPRVLVLTPTRELAAQVHESVRDYGQYLPFRSAVIFGGVSINPQKQKLIKGVEIVVATPGRLLDHVQQRSIDLSRIEILILDEADRMLDMGFIRDIRKILNVIPAQRQTLLFSATFSREIKALSSEFMNQPSQIQVTPENTAVDLVSQVVYPVDKHRKRELLSQKIGEEQWQQVLVFTRTKHGANKLAEQPHPRFMETSHKVPEPRRWQISKPVLSGFSSPRISQRVVSISTSCRMSSTLSFRIYPRTTFIESGAPRERVAKVAQCRWCVWMN